MLRSRDKKLKSGREIQSVFSANLRTLISSEKSVTQLCRNLRINRTQFNRYLSGDATPRPILLNRICQHFNVDARILLEPLEQIRNPLRDPTIQALLNIFNGVIHPVPHATLPDGIYAQWTASLIHPGQVTFILARVYTQNGVRRFRFRLPDPLKPVDKTKIYQSNAPTCHGIVFTQGGGFAVVDKNPKSQVLSLASYRVGYSTHPHIFLGVKLVGTSFSTSHLHSYGPCFLEKIPDDTRSLLATARTRFLHDFGDAPEHVRTVLREIADDAPEILLPDPCIE